MYVYGKQIFLYLLENKIDIVQEFILSKEIDKKLFSKIAKTGKKIYNVDNQKAQSLARGGNHQGFIIKIDDIELKKFDDIKKDKLVLVLCGVTDVGNIGAIIRSAYALGVDSITLTEIQNINIEAIIRSSSGACLDFDVAIRKNTLDVVNELKQQGFECIGADMSGDDVREITTGDKKAIFMGSESVGLSNKVTKKMDKLVSIKMEREFDSLNVSVASAILIDRIR
jgi:23S rRNA (guanosine2251-2'-O)-methyltransferase